MKFANFDSASKWIDSARKQLNNGTAVLYDTNGTAIDWHSPFDGPIDGPYTRLFLDQINHVWTVKLETYKAGSLRDNIPPKIVNISHLKNT